MSQPSITVEELDGQLGVLPPTAGRPYAVLGVAHSGAMNTPAGYGRKAPLIAAHGGGEGVEAAAHMLDVYGRPVVFCRTGQTVAGAYYSTTGEDGTVSALDLDDFDGTSDVTVGDDTPDGAYDVVVLFASGSVVGVAGSVYQISLDGGETYGLAVALDTATSIDLGIGVTLDFTNGGGETIAAGDIISFSTTAPIPDTDGTFDTTLTGAGGECTASVTGTPNGAYELKVLFVDGGTRGTPGITYKESLDGGRTYGPVKSLGVATSITNILGSGCGVSLTAGTVAAGDYVYAQTKAPQWNSAELSAGLEALKNTALDFEIVHIVGDLSADDIDTIDAAATSFANVGKYPTFYGHFRMPAGSETDSAYQTAFSAANSAKASTNISFTAGVAEFTSGVSGYRYRKPHSYLTAALNAFVSPEKDIAETLPRHKLNCTLTDSLGNPKHHDETVNPGLDDARAHVLRTWLGGPQGVFSNNPRLFSATGSDFEFVQHRRVMNIARAALRRFLQKRLSKPIRVDKTTGFVLEEEAQEIESGARAALDAAGMNGRYASGREFSLSRTDNVLSSKTLTCDARIIPLAYPKDINLTIAYKNPTLGITQV